MGQYSDLTDAAQASPASATALGARLASETPPDRAAQALQMARRYGLPAGVAETFVDDYKARATMEDNRALLERAPRLQSWVDRNPMRAAAAQDDMPSLAEVERRIAQFGELKAPDPIKPSFSTVASGLFESFTQGFRMMREGARMQAGDVLGLPIEDAQRRYEQARARADASRPEFESSTARGLYGGGESLARMLPSAAAAIALRNPALVLVSAGAQTQTEAYGKYRTRGATAGEAALGSFGEGAVEMATEKIPMGFLVDRFGKAGAYEFLKGMLLREMPTEQVATLLQDAIDTAVANPDKTWGEYFSERPEAAYQTALGVLVQSSFFGAANTVARRLAKDDDRAQQAEQTALAAQELSKLAEASKLRGRDAESFREFVQQVADEEGDAPTEFYIDGAVLANTLNQSGVTMQELEAIAPVVASQLEAAMTGGDVRVPVSEFLTAGEALTAPLVDHLRMTPDGMSRAEAQDYMKEQGDRIQREVEAELQRVDDQAQFRQSIEAVRAEFEAELSNAKRFTADVNRAYADLLANFYGATAARLGMTPQELLAKYRLRVQSKLADGQRVMEQGATITIADGFQSIKIGDTTVDVTAKDGRGSINMVETPKDKRGQGSARAALEQVVRAADAQGITLSLTPEPMDRSTSKAKLEKFYRSLGFVQNKGRNKDYTVMGAMIRRPSAPADPSILNQGAAATFFQAVAEYQGSHKPPGPDSASLDDLTKNGVYPDDVYGQNGARWYGDGTARDATAFALAYRLKGRPNASVTIYRAVPYEKTNAEKQAAIRKQLDDYMRRGIVPREWGGSRTSIGDGQGFYDWANSELERLQAEPQEGPRAKITINAGDWVTLTKEYAKEHGDGALGGNYKIISKTVKASEVFTNGDSIQEWGYWPANTYEQDNRPAAVAGEMPRAQIAFPTDITASPSVISLLQGADLSSFIHESGHFFLEVHADLATKIQQQISAGASVTAGERQIVEDMNRLLEWFGVKGDENMPPLQAWAMMSLDKKRAYHEQFARGFEAYAFEGKAPSLELQSIFQRFRSWLLQVYQTLRNLKVELNDDVRAVMGRMLASDFAIEEAEAARNMGPLFKDAESAGMTLDEFNAYQGLARGATEDAIAQLQARGLKDMRWLSRARDKALKARQQEVEELRRAVRQEVRAEVLQEPVYRAWQFLTGRVSDADKVDAPAVRKSVPGPVDNTVDSMFVAIAKMGGLRRDAAAADLGIDPKQRSPMPLFGKPLLLRDGGLTQDAMAERLGEEGYLTLDENGKVDIAEFQEKFQAELRGIKQYSYARDYADAQGLAADAGLNIDGAERGKLDLGALIERYGPADARIAKLKALRMTAKAGWDFDAVAENFGFDSGDALVTALTEATPPAETIEARTDQRMLEMFGDITSPQALQRAADEAVHNEARARVIAAELKALQAANRVREGNERTGLYRGGTVNILAKAAKEYAQQIVNRLPVRNIRPPQYAAAEARSARLAEKALAAGKLDEAAMHKRNQLVNNYAAKAAYEAQANVKKALDFFGKVNTGNAEKIAETRDVALVNVARAVLAEYGIGTKGKTALEYLDAVESNDPELAAVLRDRVGAMTAGAMPYKDMPVERVLGLADEVRALWAMAKRTRQIEIDGKLIDRARAQMDIAQRLDELGVPERIPGEGRAVTEAERRTGMLRSAWAALRRVESWADLKDAGSAARPFRRYVWQPIRDAADRYRADKAKYLKAYRDLLKTVDLGRSRIDAPELGYTFGYSRGGSGKQEILHALLHTGNDSNKRKLLVGRGWGQVTETGELDSNRWDTFIRRMVDQGVLTKADFDFVQGVWDLLEQIKPLAQKAHRDVFGRYFDEVTAQSFDTPFGTYRGGYVPALADPEVVSDAKTRALVEAENQTLALAFPQTARGFTKARVEYNKPLLLDLRSLGQHIDKVLMFAHLEQPVRDVRKVLASKEVSQPMSRADPAALDGLLTPWLNRVARQQVETPVPGSNGLMRFFTKARSRAGMAAMFANVVNTAQQITGLSIAAVKVKPRHLLHAAAQMVHSPRKTAQAVAEASPYMATRMDNEIAQATDAINDILLNPSVYERAQAWSAKHAYFMQSAVDNFIGPIVWQGAYNQALEAGETEADAVRLADAAVRQTQGSTLPEDIARFESGNAFVRMFTQFASYFNMQANLLGSEFSVLARDLGLRRGAGRGLYVFLFGFLAPALVSELIVQAARGGPGDDDDDGEYLDDWLAALTFGTLRSGVAMVPVAGQIATTAANMANSKPYDDRMSTSPAISMIESAVRAPTSVYEAIAEDKSAKKAIRDVATLITMTTGLPATAVARPLGYAADVAQDRVDPTGPIDAARGAVTGVASPASKE